MPYMFYKKKTQATTKRDVNLAKARLTKLIGGAWYEQGRSFRYNMGAISDNAGESANMQAKAELMRKIIEIIEKKGWK